LSQSHRTNLGNSDSRQARLNDSAPLPASQSYRTELVNSDCRHAFRRYPYNGDLRSPDFAGNLSRDGAANSLLPRIYTSRRSLPSKSAFGAWHAFFPLEYVHGRILGEPPDSQHLHARGALAAEPVDPHAGLLRLDERGHRARRRATFFSSS